MEGALTSCFKSRFQQFHILLTESCVVIVHKFVFISSGLDNYCSLLAIDRWGVKRVHKVINTFGTPTASLFWHKGFKMSGGDVQFSAISE